MIAKKIVKRPTIYLVDKRLTLKKVRVYAKVLKNEDFACVLNSKRILVSTNPKNYPLLFSNSAYNYDYIAFLKKEKSKEFIIDKERARIRLIVDHSNLG